MAQALLRPLFRAVRPTSSFASRPSRRCFSQRPPLHFPAKGPGAAQGGRGVIRRPQPAERSVRVLTKEASQVPSDIGILPDTFIFPSRPNRPSPFTNPGNYLSLLWKTLRFRTRDRLSLLILKLSSPKEGKGLLNRRMKIERGSIAATAVGLHRQMYTAFAEGDLATLKLICTDGIRESLTSRIAARVRGEKVTWELVKYMKGARLMSDRAARLPIDGAAIRQAVVRIASTQRLTRTKVVQGRRGEETEVTVGGSGKEKDTVEFVVLQRKMEGWVEGDWQVWGTTKETTLEDVKEWERRELE